MTEEYFKVSSGLKSLIGSELITDQYVAIFELVKNAIDANAKKITIKFENLNSNKSKISIIDNGIGMSKDDILNKWLFVAYSGKKGNNSNMSTTRQREEKIYAGSKGVGRFSCDRLGKKLNITTKKKNEKPYQISLDWKKFEEDQNTHFSKIPIEVYEEIKSKNIASGTSIVITELVDTEWNGSSLNVLKRQLSKLIRPDLNRTLKESTFEIFLEASDMLDADQKTDKPQDKINGKIGNFIFEELNIKTTKIISEVSDDGKTITTALHDKRKRIYEVVEHNHFNLLKNVTITLYYLNQSAKSTFTKRMGIQTVEFGNIFVYKNGFRIYPYGERGDDSLRIDNRAMQGYSRYLGSRSLIGQIDIQGRNLDLREATSRDAGLVKTTTYQQLAGSATHAKSLLLETMRRLEKYVVDVTSWGVSKDDFDIGKDNISIKKLITSIANISNEDRLINIEYDASILNKLDSQKNDIENIIRDLGIISSKTKNKLLDKTTLKLKNKLKFLSEDHENISQNLDATTKDNIELATQLDAKDKETLFVRASISNENKELESIQHHIYRSASQNIPIYLSKLVEGIRNDSTKEILFDLIGKIDFENKKIIALSKFVTKAQFNTMTTYIREDIIKFINEYSLNVYLEYKKIMNQNKNITITKDDNKKLTQKIKFRPIEISIIFDNLFNNALKANAKNINLMWQQNSDKQIILIVKDDGKGIEKSITEKIFDFRFSTTDGSGMGLYHVKKVIEDMGGTIAVINNTDNGTSFELRFK